MGEFMDGKPPSAGRGVRGSFTGAHPDFPPETPAEYPLPPSPGNQQAAHSAALDFLSKGAIISQARRLGLAQGKTLVLDSMDDLHSGVRPCAILDVAVLHLEVDDVVQTILQQDVAGAIAVSPVPARRYSIACDAGARGMTVNEDLVTEIFRPVPAMPSPRAVAPTCASGLDGPRLQTANVKALFAARADLRESANTTPNSGG